MYWLGINKENDNHVIQCEPCQAVGRSQQQEPAIPMKIPSKPWQNYVLTYSFRTVSGMCIIIQNVHRYISYQQQHLRMCSLPSSLVFQHLVFLKKSCDNGPQFTARKYQDFAARYGLKLTISRPCHPKGRFKPSRIYPLSKCAKDGSDHYLALLQLGSTPPDIRTPLQGELLQKRQLRTALPVNIRPPVYSEALGVALQSRQVYISHDAHAKELSKVLPAQLVQVKNNLTKEWENGVIQSNTETPRSYIVQTP